LKNSRPSSLSQIYNLKHAFEYELNNVLAFEDRQEFFRVINYFEQRITELKEEEKLCLKIQASSTKSKNSAETKI
jgi:hypothetical protein